MKKKTNLESGFLFLYDWMPVLECLPAKEVKTLLLALIARQRENKPLPQFRNPLTDSFARMIEPVIRRRLEGAAWAKKGLDGGEDPLGDPAGDPCRQEELKDKKKEEKLSKAQYKEEERKAASPLSDASRALSEQERTDLLLKGLPAAYLDARLSRAFVIADSSGQSVTEILFEWWQQDQRSYLAAQKRQEQEKEAQYYEEFFQAAIDRTFRSGTG